MKVIIAGSRGYRWSESMVERIDNLLRNQANVVIVSGGARGADEFGEKYAQYHSYRVERYPADWDRFGKSAGYRRNMQMAEAADAAIVIWDGKSPGSRHMIDIMKKAGKPTRVIRF